VRGVEQIPWLYDGLMLLTEWTGLGRWRAWLAGGARGRVLDLGTGTGRNLPRLAGDAPPVGLDPCAGSLARARRRHPAALLVQARAEALPFRDGTFDTVVSGLVFCSVEDPDAALAEIRRVLAPGGALRMLEHVRSHHRLRGAIQDWIQPAWTAVAGGCRPNRNTEENVLRAGFEVEPDGRRATDAMRRFQARPSRRG
jgi:ubiquinone/menaquinone biosynthesis C-methylase UbiE